MAPPALRRWEFTDSTQRVVLVVSGGSVSFEVGPLDRTAFGHEAVGGIQALAAFLTSPEPWMHEGPGDPQRVRRELLALTAEELAALGG